MKRNINDVFQFREKIRLCKVRKIVEVACVQHHADEQLRPLSIDSGQIPEVGILTDRWLLTAIEITNDKEPTQSFAALREAYESFVAL